MAPLGLLQRLREYWPYGKATEIPPPLSTRFAILVSLSFTVLYVLPFYLSSTTRPSATLSRNSPSVIKARVRSVYLSCTLCVIVTLYILSARAHLPFQETLKLLGWYPLSFISIGRTLLLTATLFTGPLFERFFVQKEWRNISVFRFPSSGLDVWIDWRNYVAGPFTEELLFRSLLIPINLLSPQVLVEGIKGNNAKNVVLTTPLFFGIAHVHHLYESRLTQPHVPWKFAIAQTVLQLAYTTLFGWFAAFLFVRTGSFWAVVLVHSFCNWMGLPRVWGRVERPEQILATPVAMGPPEDQPPRQNTSTNRPRKASFVRVRGNPDTIQGQALRTTNDFWSVVYYTLLVAGAVGFWKGLWPLTESSAQLANI